MAKTDKYGIEIDDGYPIRAFDSELFQSYWNNEFDACDRGYRESRIDDSLKTKEGKEKFYGFLEQMRNAPNLVGLSEKADEDVRALLCREHLQQAVQDVLLVASFTDNTPETEAARKVAEGLVAKGYPSAQLLYSEILRYEGNTERARQVLTLAENNLYATDGESDVATLTKMNLPPVQKKTNKELLTENSAQLKETSFAELASAAKNLDSVSEEHLPAEMAKMDQSIIKNYAEKPFAEYKPEDIEALTVLADKGYPRAQEWLSLCYEEKGQYSKAFSMADKLRRNPYASEAFQDAGQERVKKLLPLARKEQALRYQTTR